MNGFKKLLRLRNESLRKAIEHHSCRVTGRIFASWHLTIRSDVSVKEKLADEFYAKYLVKHYYFDGLKLFKQALHIEAAKANRFYRYNLKLKLFACWRTYARSERERTIANASLVEQHNVNRIKVKYFARWRRLPDEMKKLRARQKRLDELRSKVREIVPDFESPSASKNE